MTDHAIPHGQELSPGQRLDALFARADAAFRSLDSIRAITLDANLSAEQKLADIIATLESAAASLTSDPELTTAASCAEEIVSSVSSHWVLSQLAGMAFPETGGAYDFMKRSMEAF